MNTGPNKFEDKEVDLSNITKGIGNVFDGLSSYIYRGIRFLVRNVIIIAILFVIGLGLGIYLDSTQKTYDNQIIVVPNFNSNDYLYAKVELINSKIKEGDTLFLKNIGIKNPKKITQIKINPIVDIYKFVANNEQNYKLLQLMAEDSDINKVVEEKITSKNYAYHIITFSTTEKTSEEKTVKPILDFLNDNLFYKKLQVEFVNNIKVKMTANEQTIAQINGILEAFSKNNTDGSKSSSLVYYNENTQLNEVIKTKDELIREQGSHRLDLVGLDKIIKDNSKTINIENKKAVNGKMKIVLPFLFIFIFISIFLFRAFYRKETLKRKNQQS